MRGEAVMWKKSGVSCPTRDVIKEMDEWHQCHGHMSLSTAKKKESVIDWGEYSAPVRYAGVTLMT